MEYRLKRQWHRYRELIPPTAGEVQVRETRRSFYAGANAAISTILESLAPGVEPTEADLVMMDELEAELKEFAQAIKDGKA